MSNNAYYDVKRHKKTIHDCMSFFFTECTNSWKYFGYLWIHRFMIHYNNRGLFCDPHIIANNKERSFWKPAFANHNSSQTLKLLRYHNIHTRTIASPSQLPNLIQSQNLLIIIASIYCLRLTLHQKLFATNPSPQQLSELTQKFIGFRYKIYRKPLAAFWES